MPPATRKPKVTPTVESVLAAVGRTWFSIHDEDGLRIELSSRDNGSVHDETPGKKDIEEGRRLLKLIRKAFPLSKWRSYMEPVDEWVHVTVFMTPYTPKEKAEMKQRAQIAKLKERLDAAVKDANDAVQKDGCRSSFRTFVYDGTGYFKASIKVVFGERYLYHNHLGSGFVFADEASASLAIKPLVSQFTDLEWVRVIREPVPRRTGNKPPPHNIIEKEGYIEYECQIRKTF